MITVVLKALLLEQVGTNNATAIDVGVTHHSLRLQVSLVSNQHHRKVVSILYSQNLSVELLDLVIAVSHRISKRVHVY